MIIPSIETPRLRLRHFKPQDWPAVYAYMSDAGVMTYLPEDQLSSGQAREFVTVNSGQEAEKFPVILKRENKIFGHMVIHPWFARHTYEIGWVFHPAYHGNGYATEAAQALLH